MKQYKAGSRFGDFKELREKADYKLVDIVSKKDAIKALNLANDIIKLITNVTEDLRESIKHHIFRGIAEGQSVHEVARAITDSGLQPLEGKTLTAYQRASLIARTEIARSMTTGRLQSYANYGVEKVKILTADDDHVCPICLEAAHVFNGEKTHENIIGERVYDLDKASDLVPFHPACRCSVIAHIEHYQFPESPLTDPDILCCVPSNNTIKSLDEYDNYEKDYDAKNEFKRISNSGYISFTDKNGEHKYTVKCTENSTVNFHHGRLLNNEKFYKYEIFKDGKQEPFLTIYRSHERQGVSVSQVLKIHQRLPTKLTENCSQIRLSNQTYSTTGGYVHRKFPTKLNILGNVDIENMAYAVTHEMAHVFDFTNGMLSNSKGSNGFVTAFEEDLVKAMFDNNNLDNRKAKENYITHYSAKETVKKLDNNDDAPYTEDFAECIAMLFVNPKHLHSNCPAKEKYLHKLLDIPT